MAGRAIAPIEADRRTDTGIGRGPVLAPSVRAPRTSVYALAGISLAVMFGAFAGTVALRAVLAEQQHTIDDIGDRIALEQDRRGELRILAGQLESPDRIRVAAIRLGLVEPVEILFLPPVLPGNPATVLPAPVGDPFAPTVFPEATGDGDS